MCDRIAKKNKINTQAAAQSSKEQVVTVAPFKDSNDFIYVSRHVTLKRWYSKTRRDCALRGIKKVSNHCCANDATNGAENVEKYWKKNKTSRLAESRIETTKSWIFLF